MPVSHTPALDEAIAALVRGTQRDPFAVLGPHRDPSTGDTIVRAFQPAARSIDVWLVESNAVVPMERVDQAGVFEVRLKPDTTQASAPHPTQGSTPHATQGSAPHATQGSAPHPADGSVSANPAEDVLPVSVGSGFSRTVPDYRLRMTYPGDQTVEIDDPYRYGRVLTDFDLHLLSEGTHNRAFE